MNDKNLKLAKEFIPKEYIDIGRNGIASYYKTIETILRDKRVPKHGLSEFSIRFLLQHLAAMDSNNGIHNIGVGEREARVYSSMVAERHFGLCHGIGRSGDVAAVQPKAVGSSIMVQLTQKFANQMIKVAGVTNSKKAVVLPVATGMALTMTLLLLKSKKVGATHVLWSRIDQKSCFKSILTAGLIPVVIQNRILENGQMVTDMEEMQCQLENIGKDNVLCVMTTASCFAPRGCDLIIQVAQLCQKLEIGHIVNNAYGLQSSICCHEINQAMRLGRIDAVVQSTDKNFMVPVGGAVVCSPSPDLMEELAKSYPGRASNGPTLDLFITFLQMGTDGYVQLLRNRKELVPYFKEKLSAVAQTCDQMLIDSPHKKTTSFIGSKLFTRCVSGTRVVTTVDEKEIGPVKFIGFGAHVDAYPSAYLTAACAVGITKDEIDQFVKKLEKVLKKAQCSK